MNFKTDKLNQKLISSLRNHEITIESFNKPENLKKRLDFIGFIKDKNNIQDLHNNLSDGQILVSKSGEIWRWDGFTSKGKQNASTKAVLEQLKNRIKVERRYLKLFLDPFAGN